MTGVVLAGGEGTRLGLPYNKHLALVYDQLMIDYPIRTLGEMGCHDIIVVTNLHSYTDMRNYLGEMDYRIQSAPLGTADALAQAQGIKGVFPVLCGDTYFDPPPEPSKVPTLYWHEFEGAQNHSVWNPETNEITEKPVRDIGKRAIVAYYYDERVFDVIRELKPSERGEYELIDIHNFYLQNGADIKEYKGFFGDMGTPDGLLRVANYEQNRQTT